MASKSFLVFCSVVLMIKTISGQSCGCNNNFLNNNLGSGLSLSGLSIPSNIGLSNNQFQSCSNNLGLNNNLGNFNNQLQGITLNQLFGSNPQLLDNLSYGGTLSVSSGSPVTPTGFSISADNLVLEGALNVNGNLPVLGAIGLDGTLPSGGQAAVAYQAGNGVTLTNAGCGAGLSGIGFNNFNGLGPNFDGLGPNFDGLGPNGLGPNFNGVNLGSLNGAGLNLNGLNLNGLSLNNGNCGCGL